MFWQLLRHKGSEFSIVDGKLLAGTYQINGNFELPDKVQAIFGGVATIFMGDVRVTTNELNATGQRAIGTRLTGPAYDAVFRQGKPYRGEAPILGAPYLTAYDPIKDRILAEANRVRLVQAGSIPAYLAYIFAALILLLLFGGGGGYYGY